jgi:hypothetical protein
MVNALKNDTSLLKGLFACLDKHINPAKPKTALDNGKTALGPGRKLSIEVFSTTTRSTHSKRVANRSPMIGLAVTKKFSLW